MRRVLAVALVAFAFGCAGREKPLSEPGERVYALQGEIEGRDAADNVIRVKHEKIPGFMEAMTMDFSVRGAEVTSLPADGSRIEATLHVTDRAYWLTDVKSR